MTKTKSLAKGLEVTYSLAIDGEQQDSVIIYVGNKMIGIDVPCGHMLEDLGLRYSDGKKGWKPISFEDSGG